MVEGLFFYEVHHDVYNLVEMRNNSSRILVKYNINYRAEDRAKGGYTLPVELFSTIISAYRVKPASLERSDSIADHAY